MTIQRLMIRIFVACPLFIGPLSAVVAPAVAGNAQGPGVTADGLRALIYGDNIPGFHKLTTVRSGDDSDVVIDLARPQGDTASRITGGWDSDDGLVRLDMTVAVYESRQTAMDSAQFYANSGQFRTSPMPAAVQIGEGSWSWPREYDYGLIRFVLGRTLTTVQVGMTRRVVSPVSSRD